MIRLAALALGLVLVVSAAASARPAAIHPGIFVDAATVKTLKARAKKNTAEWKALRTRCDELLRGKVSYPDGADYPTPGIGEGYQGSGYFSAVLDLGMCSIAAPKDNAKYGKRGAEVLDKMSDRAHSPDPLRDAGYGIRFYGVGMAVGYDWLHRWLNLEVRKNVIAALNRWIGAYEDDGFERDFPQGNYFAGYFAAKLLAALATENEDLLTTAGWERWFENVFPYTKAYYAENLSGGGWPEGWNYGPLAVLNMTWPVDAARISKGIDLLAEGYAFPVNTARFIVAFTWPDLLSLEDSGTQRENDRPAPTDPKLATAMAAMLARFKDPFAPTMHSYARAVRAAQPALVRGAELGRWLDFLYWDPKAPETDFRTSPLSYFAPGMEMAAMRSSWQKDAVWASFKGGPYVNYPGANEELFDEGQLVIVNGAKQYLVNAPAALMRNTPGTEDGVPYEERIYDNLYNDEGPRDLFNVFYVSLPAPTGQSDVLRSDGARTATTFDDRGAYAIVRATHLEDLYPRDRAAEKTISSWSRDVVYVRPGLFVVRDLTDVTDGSIDQWLSWHFLGRPSNAQVLAPAARTERTVDVFDSHKIYRLEVHAAGNERQHEWITVLQPRGGPAATLAGGVVTVGQTRITFAADGSISVAT